MKGSTLVLAVIGSGIGILLLLVGIMMNSKTATSSTAARVATQTGFVKVPLPEGAVANQVLIVGPNCHRPQGVRTRALASGLAKLNIPYQQTSSVRMSSDVGLGNIFQLNQLMAGDAPIVFVNRKGKANPSLDEVLAEYRLATTFQ
jgi:hypothetical protein